MRRKKTGNSESMKLLQVAHCFVQDPRNPFKPSTREPSPASTAHSVPHMRRVQNACKLTSRVNNK